MRKQPGFISWQINKLADGSYKDLVQWESKETAEAATVAMAEIPQDSPWYACYDMTSVSSAPMSEVKMVS
jgi:hypothetical protein